jgi:hypothetical protein
MVSEIERLKSDASARAAEIIRVVSEKELLVSELGGLRSEFAALNTIKALEIEDLEATIITKDTILTQLRIASEAKSLEYEDLITSLSTKDATIAQLQQGGGGTGVAFLQQKDYDTLYKEYEREQKEKHEAWDSLRAIQAPQAVGGSYKRVLDLLESAAAVTNMRTEWDRSVCNTLAEEMVKGMLSSAEAGRVSVVNEHTAKVFDLVFVLAHNRYLITLSLSQIMRPLMHICGELIEHRGLKRARDGTGFVPPVVKKPKRGGGGGAGRVYEEVPGWA